MDEIVDGAAVAESPTAEVAESQATSAGTQNTVTNGQPPAMKGFHEHPDWQRMVRERNEYRQSMAEMQRELAEHRQWRQQQEAQRGLTPEQEQFVKAGDALEKIIQSHPRLKDRWEQIDKAGQAHQTVQQLQKTQQEAHQRAARSEIASIAKAEGMTSPKAASHLEAILAQELIEMGPEAIQKYHRGDFSVFKEAYDRAKGDGLIAALRQQSTAQTLATKTATRNLPPRPVGGQVTREAPAKHEPDSKEWRRSLAEKARAVISGGA